MKRISLTSWIFISMVLGVAIGAIFPDIGKADWMAAIANVFLRLIKSIIAPLIFGTLVAGIAGTGSVKTMGRIGLKAIIPKNEGRWKCRVEFPTLAHRVTLMILRGAIFRRSINGRNCFSTDLTFSIPNISMSRSS